MPTRRSSWCGGGQRHGIRSSRPPSCCAWWMLGSPASSSTRSIFQRSASMNSVILDKLVLDAAGATGSGDPAGTIQDDDLAALPALPPADSGRDLAARTEAVAAIAAQFADAVDRDARFPHETLD